MSPTRAPVPSEQSARSVTAAIRAHFADGRINPDTYRDQITDDLSPDPGDRAHVAACLDGRASVLVTSNLKHYQSPRLSQHGVRVMTADEYLCELFDADPIAITDSFIGTVNIRSRPPITAQGFAHRVAAAGAPRFASRIRSRLNRPPTDDD